MHLLHVHVCVCTIPQRVPRNVAILAEGQTESEMRDVVSTWSNDVECHDSAVLEISTDQKASSAFPWCFAFKLAKVI